MNQMVQFEKILGLYFTIGEAKNVVKLVSEERGLLVVPSAPALSRINKDPQYREAILGADHIIADSTLMVVLWSLISRTRIPKLSGLEYFREFLSQYDATANSSTFWVMPTVRSSELLISHMKDRGFKVSGEMIYVAPRYETPIEDIQLLKRLNELKPRNIMMGVGGGIQEPLGFYLNRRLNYKPAIHCIGAAIGFVTGDQVSIPKTWDNLGCGWLIRCISNPARFVPRYLSALRLISLMVRFGDDLPC